MDKFLCENVISACEKTLLRHEAEGSALSAFAVRRVLRRAKILKAESPFVNYEELLVHLSGDEVDLIADEYLKILNL